MNIASAFLLATLVLGCASAQGASDAFAAVQCKSDIAKALIGQTMSNESTAAIEGRHKDLGLKDLGGSEVSDELFLSSWRICAEEYQLLEEKGIVRDVLKFPGHSKDSPEFVGACLSNGKQAPGVVVAVLTNEKDAATLAATAAWTIDEKAKRFSRLQTQGLRCPRDGVITADGGT
jgi:hypothetical protein